MYMHAANLIQRERLRDSYTNIKNENLNIYSIDSE